MLHLHGPWGSGKSSILNFLRDELQGEQRRPEERWVVVEFNAWRHQRIRPPWWALIRDVYAQSARQLSPLHALWLRVRWWAWRVRADWLPVAGAAVIITLAVLVITGVIDLFPEPAQTAPPGTQAQRQADEAWKGVELALKLLTAALAAWGALFAVSRSLAFGSARAAQAYTELKSDPLGPIVRLFQRLTDRIGRPVAVFIDDLHVLSRLMSFGREFPVTDVTREMATLIRLHRRVVQAVRRHDAKMVRKWMMRQLKPNKRLLLDRYDAWLAARQGRWTVPLIRDIRQKERRLAPTATTKQRRASRK
jgi:hypothetical protein